MKKISKLRQGREARIKERIKKLNKWEAYEYLKTHLEYAEKTKDQQKKLLHRELDNFSATLLEIKSLLKYLKKFVPNILEQNKITAVYQLITKSFFDLEAIIQLEKEGFSFQIFEIARSANEAIDLVFLFMDESDGKHLDKWFRGDIIPNEISRKSADKVINSGIFGNTKYPVYELKRDVYDTYSEFTHSGYGAILDLVDPFHKDLDFSRLAGYHFALRYFEVTVQNTGFNILIALKYVFIYLFEVEKINQIDKLILQLNTLQATRQEILGILKNDI